MFDDPKPHVQNTEGSHFPNIGYTLKTDNERAVIYAIEQDAKALKHAKEQNSLRLSFFFGVVALAFLFTAMYSCNSQHVASSMKEIENRNVCIRSGNSSIVYNGAYVCVDKDLANQLLAKSQ